MTIVEYVRDFLRLSEANSHALKVLEREYGYLTENLFGAYFTRGKDYYPRLFNQRSVLLPVMRPSEESALLIKGREEKKNARQIIQRQPQAKAKLRMISPGFYTHSGLPVKINGSKELVLHRRCWVYFTNPREAVQYLLDGGEKANQLREEPSLSIHRLARHLQFEMDWLELRQLLVHVAEDSHGVRSENPVMSATSRPEIVNGVGVKGNLQIQVKTGRAMPLHFNPVSIHEDEWAIPYVINPAEIQEAQLLFMGQKNFLPEDEGIMSFEWSQDYVSLTVHVEYPRRRQTEKLFYRFDSESRSYQEVASRVSLRLVGGNSRPRVTLVGSVPDEEDEIPLVAGARHLAERKTNQTAGASHRMLSNSATTATPPSSVITLSVGR